MAERSTDWPVEPTTPEARVTLRSFLDEVEAPANPLVLIDEREPAAIRGLLESVFEGQPVSVGERAVETAAEEVVLMEDGPDGPTIRARSSIEALNETVLMVNSDLYKTGSVDLAAIDVPDVLLELDDVPFRLRGYPQAHKEKLLLIAISRYIERRAWRAEAGTLRSSFQRLDRIDDERGTRAVYAALAETDVDVHVYGMGTAASIDDLDVTIHTGTGADYRDAWFVIYTPANTGGLPPAALLALEDAPGVWDGYWTFRPERVEAIDAHVATQL